MRLKYLDNDLWLWAKVRATTAADWLKARRELRSNPGMFDATRRFCTFIGHPRSGHSVVSSILDAHPDAVFSHRLDAWKWISRGVRPDTVFYLILRNSERFAKSGRRLTGYSYPIPGQWQGRARSPVVVGDQEGKWTATRLSGFCGPPDAFRDRDIDLSFIHVVRNPFDNITTIANRMGRSLPAVVDAYFELCHRATAAKNKFGSENVFELRHEALLAEPEQKIVELCSFLKLDSPSEFVQGCADIVYASPNRSRVTRDWSADLIKQVTELAKQFEFLSGYTYTE